MFVKYNAVLRSCLRVNGKPVEFFVKAAEGLCQGNQFCTTIHVISSGILKLSKIEAAGKVYRGLSGLKLPDAMLKPNAEGVRGGVECSFVSATRDRAVASAYSAGSCVRERNQRAAPSHHIITPRTLLSAHIRIAQVCRDRLRDRHGHC